MCILYWTLKIDVSTGHLGHSCSLSITGCFNFIRTKRRGGAAAQALHLWLWVRGSRVPLPLNLLWLWSASEDQRLLKFCGKEEAHFPPNQFSPWPFKFRTSKRFVARRAFLTDIWRCILSDPGQQNGLIHPNPLKSLASKGIWQNFIVRKARPGRDKRFHRTFFRECDKLQY